MLSLATKATEWKTVVKSGRTHLMDAVPVTLGQEFGGYARQIEAGIERVNATLPRLGRAADRRNSSRHRSQCSGWDSAPKLLPNWSSRPVSTR